MISGNLNIPLPCTEKNCIGCLLLRMTAKAMIFSKLWPGTIRCILIRDSKINVLVTAPVFAIINVYFTKRREESRQIVKFEQFYLLFESDWPLECKKRKNKYFPPHMYLAPFSCQKANKYLLDIVITVMWLARPSLWLKGKLLTVRL